MLTVTILSVPMTVIAKLVSKMIQMMIRFASILTNVTLEVTTVTKRLKFVLILQDHMIVSAPMGKKLKLTQMPQAVTKMVTRTLKLPITLLK